MKKLFLFLMLTIMLFVFTACSSPQVSPTAQAIINTKATAYPALVDQAAAAYPDPKNVHFPTVDPKTINTPKEAPIPEKGKSSISGVLYSKDNSTILSQFMVYVTLAQGVEKNMVPGVLAGPISSIGDVKTNTDQNGKFEINNLPPGNYFIIIKNPTTYDVAMKSIDDEKPRMITLKPDQRETLGLVIVP